MGKDCSENDERSITISGSAKQVDTYQKKSKILLKVRYARLMIYDVIEGKRGSRGQHGSQ